MVGLILVEELTDQVIYIEHQSSSSSFRSRLTINVLRFQRNPSSTFLKGCLFKKKDLKRTML